IEMVWNPAIKLGGHLYKRLSQHVYAFIQKIVGGLHLKEPFQDKTENEVPTVIARRPVERAEITKLEPGKHNIELKPPANAVAGPVIQRIVETEVCSVKHHEWLNRNEVSSVCDKVCNGQNLLREELLHFMP